MQQDHFQLIPFRDIRLVALEGLTLKYWYNDREFEHTFRNKKQMNEFFSLWVNKGAEIELFNPRDWQ